jgi:5,10-methylenetetrahydromethanopterin reductase
MTRVPRSRLGAYVLPGAAHDPVSGIAQAEATERMGFGTVWIGERYDTKDLGALGGALSQVTRRVQVAAGITHPYLRHPMVLASMGQTLQALTGGRFLLGLGRSASWRWAAYGQPSPTLAALADIAGILRRLWDGQTVEYDGPLGRFPQLRLPVVLDAAPPLLLAAIGPKTLALAGRCYDGVILHPLLTPEAVRRSADIVRTAAQEAGRDPDSVRCYATVLCAPEVSDAERQLAIEARAAGYLSLPGLGDSLARINGWEEADLARYRGQRLLAELGTKPADKNLTRAELIKLCEGMPASWLASCTAAGTARQTASVLARYLAAGADELILHGVVGEGLAPLADYLAAEGG